MKNTLVVIFLLPLFSITLSYNIFGKKIINLIKENKENSRKLEEVDSIIIDYTYEDITEYIITDDKKNASLQIVSFINYERKNTEINFEVLFFFYRIKIPRNILFQLGITYANNRRNLDDSYESVQTECTIKNESLIGQEAEGDTIDYDCSANTRKKGKLKTVKLKTDAPLIIQSNIGNDTVETISFDEINFKEEAAIEAENITISRTIVKVGILTEAEVEFPIQEDYFRIYGSLNREDLSNNEEILNFKFLNEKGGKKRSEFFKCKIINITQKYGIECDTNNKPIKSRIQDIHLSSGTSNSNNSNIMLILEMKNWENNNTIIETPNSSIGEKNITIYEPPTIIDANIPINTETKNLDKKTAPFQINRFANYERKNQQINYITFLNFYNHKIEKSIIFRLRVTYLKNLRNLEEEKIAESVPSVCDIKNENLVGQDNPGNNVEYECEVPTLTDIQKLENVTLNIDNSLIVPGESNPFSFKDVNFNGNSSEDLNNLIDIKIVKNNGTLEDAQIQFPITNNYFIIYGTLNPSNLLSIGEIIPITILAQTKGEKSPTTYQCNVIQVSPNCFLQCETENQPLNSTIQDLHLSNGVSDSNKLLTIKMKDWENNNLAIETPSNNKIPIIYESRESKDLSKGAIIAIIISCVAFLCGATFIAFMLKKKENSFSLQNNSKIESKINSKINSKIEPKIDPKIDPKIAPYSITESKVNLEKIKF